MPLPNKKTLAGILGAPAAALAITAIGNFEGVRNTPYVDAGGKATVCQGLTNVPMHYYTNAQCAVLFGQAMTSAASYVESHTPDFATLSDDQKTAALSFAYNTGIGNYRSMLAGRGFAQSCDSIIKYDRVGGKDCSVRANGCYGVYSRRLWEQQTCRTK